MRGSALHQTEAARAARAAGHPVGSRQRSVQDATRTGRTGEPAVAALLALAPARRIRLELLDVAERLIVEFAGRRPPGAVLRCVAGCRADLRGSGLTAGLPEAVDRLARQRLIDQSATAGQTAEA